MVSSTKNWAGRDVSIQTRFKLSRSVMTIVYDFAGHEEWLRLRQVCRLFDDSSHSMAKYWPVVAQQKLAALRDEEKNILAADGLQELIDSIERDIAENYNKVVSHREMKDRIISHITERKPAFTIERRWKPADSVS